MPKYRRSQLVTSGGGQKPIYITSEKRGRLAFCPEALLPEFYPISVVGRNGHIYIYVCIHLTVRDIDNNSQT